ncbi:hypothetical protein ACFLY4_00275 [Chloroflexota bacterium]
MIHFHLYPNITSGKTTVKIDEQSVEPVIELEDIALRVPLVPALEPGEEVLGLPSLVILESTVVHEAAR